MIEFDLFDADVESIATAALTQKVLVDTQDRLGSVLEAMPIGLMFHSEQAILYANKQVCELLQLPKEQLFGQHFLDYVRDAEAKKTAELLGKSFSSGGKVHMIESVVVRKNAQERIVKIVAGRLPWDGNPLLQLLIQDITDQKHAENSLRKLSITDELTGAFNRRHAFYEGALYLDKARSESLPVSVSLIDIDHFKRINDNFGHAIGDQALVDLTSLANKFVANIKGADSPMFARLGGEEFLMLLPGFNCHEAAQIAEQFRQQVESMRIDAPGHAALKFTISTGIACYKISDDTFDAPLSRADTALYQAKESGRNKVIIANP